MKKRGVALSYKTGKFIKNVKNRPKELERVVAIFV